MISCYNWPWVCLSRRSLVLLVKRSWNMETEDKPSVYRLIPKKKPFFCIFLIKRHLKKESQGLHYQPGNSWHTNYQQLWKTSNTISCEKNCIVHCGSTTCPLRSTTCTLLLKPQFWEKHEDTRHSHVWFDVDISMHLISFQPIS